MPAKKKRSSTPAARASPMKKARRTTGKAGEPDKLTTWFNQYKTEEEGPSVGPEGITKLCQDLELDPADRKILILAFKLRAQRQGFFSWDEFQQGMGELGASDVKQLRKALDSSERSVMTGTASLRDFFNYAFQFNLMEPAQKIIDKDTAMQMLEIVVGDNAHIPSFTSFLREQTEYKTINRDQWSGLYRFIQEVKPDCSNFDESQAWPLLLDNYVEWFHRQDQMED